MGNTDINFLAISVLTSYSNDIFLGPSQVKISPQGLCKVSLYLPILPEDHAQSIRKPSKQGARLCQIACLPQQQGMTVCYRATGIHRLGFKPYLCLVCSADFALLP